MAEMHQGSPAFGGVSCSSISVTANAYVAADREDRVGVTELVGDDSGVELQVEEHPARRNVA
jgi:hypothetical protein